MGGTIGCARREATLAGLEFAPTGGRKDTFVGVPRSAVLSHMQGRDNKIAVPPNDSSRPEEPARGPPDAAAVPSLPAGSL